MDCWVGTQGQMKLAKNSPTSDVPHREPKTEKQNFQPKLKDLNL